MKRFARGALTLAFWLTVWAALALLVHRELLLPAPWVVVRRLCELAATAAFWRITAVSIGRVLLGITAAVTLGTGMAVACAASKTADALLRPLMTVVKSTPVASFVVLALIWIARDWLPVFIALLMVLPVVWSNVCTGIRSADPALLELARVYGWPRGRVLRRIYVPSVRPHFLAALRSGLGFGWKAGIAAEVLTVPHSAIGRMIYESKLYLQTTDLFAWTLAVILLSVGLERLVLRAGAVTSSFPGFFVQLVLLMLLARTFAIFPLRGSLSVPPPTDFWPLLYDYCRHLALPVLSLTLMGFGGWALYVRNLMVRALGEDFVLMARARGLPPRRVVYGHAFRTILPPILTILLMSLPGLVSGAVITESVFSLYGVGTFLLEAVSGHDYPSAGAAFYLLALMTVFCNLAADIVYGFADPRVRIEGENN